MKQFISQLSINSKGEGFINLTDAINRWIKVKKIREGILVITCQHTSCSLIINENADPRVLQDLAAYMKAIVPEIGFKSILRNEEIKEYLHSEEGLDDMPAHIKTTLTSSNLSISIRESMLDLGTWQAIYLWEHRYSSNVRKINLHAIGETGAIKLEESYEGFNTVMSTDDPAKLNKIVLDSINPVSSSDENGSDTKTDLLIDRIHDLTEPTQ